jgi:phage FluMu gp28-like protein
LAQRLTREGLPMREVSFTGASLQSMASELLGAFAERRISLYPDAGLVADLRRLRVVEKSYGVRLDAARTSDGHADRATGLALALLAARRFPWVSAEYQGDVVLWPPLDGSGRMVMDD